MITENVPKGSYNLPGGHGVHPSVPFDEKLENVPTGHGRNFNGFSDIFLNPDANRAESTASLAMPGPPSGSIFSS